MGLVYHDINPAEKKPFASAGKMWHTPRCVEHYAENYNNFMYLRFIRNHKDSTYYEKHRAEKEIAIASQRCDFWRKVIKHQNRLGELLQIEKNILENWSRKG